MCTTSPSTIATALTQYRTAKAFLDAKLPMTKAQQRKGFENLNAAIRTLIATPAKTLDDVATKLEYAIEDELCGGQTTGELAGLDTAMFREILEVVRGAESGRSTLDVEAIKARTDVFARSVETEPPASILRSDGSPSAALVDFGERYDLTMDWLVTGEGEMFRVNASILALYRTYWKIIEAAEKYNTTTTGPSEDDELQRLFYVFSDRLEQTIMAKPSTCAADFAAKMIIDTCKGGLMVDWESGATWKEARALVGTASDALELAKRTDTSRGEAGAVDKLLNGVPPV